MADKSIRQIIAETSEELRGKIDLLEPQVASRKLIELSSLFSSLYAQIAKYDAECRYQLNEIYKKQEKHNVSAARLEMEALPEWNEFNQARLQAVALTELIRSIKLFIKTNSEDIFHQRNV